MNPKDSDEEDKTCPHCNQTFSSKSGRNRHLQKNICEKSESMTPARSTRNPQPLLDPPAVLLTEDHTGLLLGHSCLFSK